MSDTVLDVLKKKLLEDVQFKTEALCRGNPTDYAAYRDLCGEIRGLTRAIDVVEGYAQNLKEAEDE